MVIFNHLFHIDSLSLIMTFLVGFVALCVAAFSTRYLNGDRQKSRFFLNLIGMVLSVFIMVNTDHIGLLVISWGAANFFLVRMMLHKKEWMAARRSSLLAFQNFGLGLSLLGSAMGLLYSESGQTSIQEMLNTNIGTTPLLISSLLIFLAAMTQSSLWPFHRWLTSSLNSPTPVSALMHAGLINGGGFLLCRFALLIAKQPAMLNIIFISGICTALLGTLWKLMQNDIKRMLACSTMGQMGFMIAQCGLGLFPAAIVHLCFHGLFKAYLFLASGSAAQEKRSKTNEYPSLKELFIALLCGLNGAYFFSLISHKNPLIGDTNIFLIALTAISGTQFALPFIRSHFKTKFPLALLFTTIVGALYGVSVFLMERALEPLNICFPQTLNPLHIFALGALVASWLSMLFATTAKKEWQLASYVWMLNASQPHPKTITAHRNQYQF